jgi:hypothetical protein
MSENSNGSRLPPPAFPPGTRKHVARSAAPVEADVEESTSADVAFISPDEPLPPRADPMGDAFISPDDPMPERKIELLPEFDTEVRFEPGEEGVVVGMDLDAHLDEAEIVSGGDPYVMEVMAAVANLAELLQNRGEAGLRASPDMSRFEATLRSYCVGFLAGRRADGPPPPILEEPLSTDG